MIFLRRKVYKRDVADDEIEQVRYSFDESYQMFLSSKQAMNVRKPTIVSYGEHYNFFMRWLAYRKHELVYPDELTTFIVTDYINYMRADHYNFKTKKAGLSDLTVNARIRFLKTFFSYLSTEQMIDGNIMEKVRYLKTDKHHMELLTEQEMKQLLNAPDVKLYPQWRDKVFMHMLYDTCLRMHEAIGLQEVDIDLMAKRIKLPASKAKERRHRMIPISMKTANMLAKLIAENKQAFGEVDYIFLNWYGEKLAEDTFRRGLKRYLNIAGITKKFTCHDFRRQGITEMLKNGASLFAVQAIAGHSQISTTRKYVYFDDTTIQEQHAKYSPLTNQVYKTRGNQKETGKEF